LQASSITDFYLHSQVCQKKRAYAMLKNTHEFIIRQLSVKNRKDALLLPCKLAIIYLVISKIADDIRFFKCAWAFHDYETVVLYIAESGFLIFLLVMIWKLVTYFKNKGKLKKAATVFILFNLFSLLFTKSLSFIYFLDGPYLGRVTDADTGEPVEGAIVVGSWNIFYLESPWTGMDEAFADVRETVTNKYGWFVLPFGRKVWIRPFSVISKAKIYVFIRGYDSYPPSMYKAWNDKEAQQWGRKLEKLYPDHEAWKPKSGVKTDSPYYLKLVYYEIFQTKGDYEIFNPINIRLNKAHSIKEHQTIISRLMRKQCNCRAARFYKAVREEKKRLESLSEAK